MNKCHAINVPADPHARLDSSMYPSYPEEIQIMSSKPYNKAIGCLAYAAVCTRPDISFAGQTTCFCKNPGRAHWAAIKRILSYLAGTTTHGILFSGEEPTNMVGYTDSDYAGDIDTRRSISGYIDNPAPPSLQQRLNM